MNTFIDLTGEKFARLTAMWPCGRTGKNSTACWLCVCECGRFTPVRVEGLRSGKTQSCGCLRSEVNANRAKNLFTKHGHARRGKITPTFHSWTAMLYRCLSPNTDNYARYGGAGIQVCDRWNPNAGGSFENFLADMGERPQGKTLDRWPDTNGNYTSDNTRWATPAEQTQNRSVVKLTPEKVIDIRQRRTQGESISAIAANYGLSYSTVRAAAVRERWSSVA